MYKQSIVETFDVEREIDYTVLDQLRVHDFDSSALYIFQPFRYQMQLNALANNADSGETARNKNMH